jgi:glutaredoxin
MIRIYTLKGCGYCNELKELLQKENIEYKDINVDLPENQKEFNKVLEITKSEYLPQILVNKRLLIANKSYQSISEAVELIKKFLNS